MWSIHYHFIVIITVLALLFTTTRLPTLYNIIKLYIFKDFVRSFFCCLPRIIVRIIINKGRHALHKRRPSTVSCLGKILCDCDCVWRLLPRERHNERPTPGRGKTDCLLSVRLESHFIATQ